MSTTTTKIQTSTLMQRGKVARGRLWRVGLLAVISSVMVNFLLALLARTFLPISSDFVYLQTHDILPLTIAGAVGATLVFALVNRFFRNPIMIYRIIATVVLLLSFIPDFPLINTAGASVLAVGALMFLHVATYLVCVGLLTVVAPAKYLDTNGAGLVSENWASR